MTHQDAPDLDTLFSAEFWDDRYRGSEHVWSGRVQVDEGIPRWHIRELLHTPAELAALHDDQAWTIEFADTVARTGPGPGGAALTMWDAVVVAVRH